MANDLQSFLTVRVDPADMVQYVHNLMSIPSGAASEASVALAQRQWGGDTPLARAAHMRWSALNRAFGDARVGSWTQPRKSDQIHVPAALIAAAGVAKLTVAEDQVVFDIPTLLDATLQLAQPAGHA
ncbi:MAG: hypothetical protein ACLPX1_01705 [Steroidobacteraceae bacterium]